MQKESDQVTEESRPALWRVIFAVMAAPGEIVRRHAGALPAPLALGVPTLAFALFFLQTAIDLHRSPRWGGAEVVGALVLAGTGAALGSLGVALLAALAWALTRPFGGEATLGWSVRAFGLAYSPTLVYAACGVVVQGVLGWPTTLAFGVTGYLWALAPLHTTLLQMAKGRAFPAAILTTGLGATLLLAWAFLGLGRLA